MKIILIFLLILILCSQCTEPHINAAHKVRSAFIKKVKREGFQVFATGGAMMDDVKVVDVVFQKSQNVDVKVARMMLMRYAQLLMHDMNADEELRPYLHDYPVTPKNINLTILFFKEDDDFVNPPYIARVAISAHDAYIDYSIDNKETNRLDTVFVEPYEMALQIYQENLQKCTVIRD